MPRTGVAHASAGSRIAAHSSRVFVAKTAAKRCLSSGQRDWSICGNSAGSSSISSSSFA